MSLRDLLKGNDEVKEDVKAPTGAEGGDDALKDEITTDMLISDILRAHPISAQFLMDCGMECIFCPASQMETLEQACSVHGIDAEEICAALNERIESYRT